MSSFLDEADKQEDKAAAIMRLGAAQEFLRHFQGPGYREAIFTNANDINEKVLKGQYAIIKLGKMIFSAVNETWFVKPLEHLVYFHPNLQILHTSQGYWLTDVLNSCEPACEKSSVQ